MIKITGTTSTIEDIRYEFDFLNKNGIKISVDDKDENHVSIVIDTAILKQKIMRGGRYPKLISEYKIEDVLKMRETKIDKEIYELLGISKATFYRRLKNANTLIKELGKEAEKEFRF